MRIVPLLTSVVLASAAFASLLVLPERSAAHPPAIVSEAQRQHFPAALALAVAWQESGWQGRVVSSAGAVGVMQLLPPTADWVSAISSEAARKFRCRATASNARR